MSEAATKSQIRLARVAVVLIFVLILIGLLRYGVSAEVYDRIWKDIAERPWRADDLPLHSPARNGDGCRPDRRHQGCAPRPFPLSPDRPINPDERAGRLREGLIATARIILLGLGMDAVYQALVLKTFYPGEMVIVALLLAFVPYLLLRGPFARLARWWIGRRASSSVS